MEPSESGQGHHRPEEFVKAEDRYTWGYDPRRKLRFEGGRLFFQGDVVNLKSVRGTAVSVEVRFDKTDGLIGSYLVGHIVGFPDQPSGATVVDGFGYGDSVEFLAVQVEHVELCNEAHFD